MLGVKFSRIDKQPRFRVESILQMLDAVISKPHLKAAPGSEGTRRIREIRVDVVEGTYKGPL